MNDIFTQIGNKNTQNVDKKNTKSASNIKFIITAIITIIAAILASPWIPQIWDKIIAYFN